MHFRKTFPCITRNADTHLLSWSANLCLPWDLERRNYFIRNLRGAQIKGRVKFVLAVEVLWLEFLEKHELNRSFFINNEKLDITFLFTKLDITLLLFAGITSLANESAVSNINFSINQNSKFYIRMIKGSIVAVTFEM